MPTYYGFWDGDFAFYSVEYADQPTSIIRVRVDNESPEERVRQNMTNANNMDDGWKKIRPSTDEEIVRWGERYAHSFPMRTADETEALKLLRRKGKVLETEMPNHTLWETLKSLTEPRRCVRDFVPDNLVFVGYRDGVFFLTTEGEWLTSLME